MSESDSPTEPAPIAGARALAFLGGLLIFGIAVQTLLARADRGSVAALEMFSETTAVGDRVFFPVPSPLPKTPVTVARVGGAALVPVNYEKFGCRDTKMQPTARDPATKLTIYESREPVSEGGGEKFFFVKTGVNEYLKLRAAK